MKNLGPAPTRVRPEGPSNCWRTRNVAASCDVCGARPEVVHIPMHGRGFRCQEHCENCGPAQKSHLGTLGERA